jgi:hypothetical protein
MVTIAASAESYGTKAEEFDTVSHTTVAPLEIQRLVDSLPCFIYHDSPCSTKNDLESLLEGF